MGLLEEIANLLNGLGNTLLGGLAEVVEGLRNGLSWLSAQISATANAVLQGVIYAVTEMAARITAAFGWLRDFLANTFAGLTHAVTQAISWIMQSTTQLIKNAVDWLWNGLNAAGKWITENLAGVVAWLAERVRDAVTAVAQAVHDLVTIQLPQALNTQVVVEALERLPANLLQSVSSARQAVEEWLSNLLIEAANEFIKSYSTTLRMLLQAAPVG